MKSEPLKIKRCGEDGNKIITVRIRKDTLDALDKIAAETNCSCNELINIIPGSCVLLLVMIVLYFVLSPVWLFNFQILHSMTLEYN